jgi:hypothetical protein
MSFQVFGIVVAALVLLLIRYLNYTDTPKIKNLPEVPGVPLFGNLLQFGSSHAKAAREFAQKYGPVFQVRLGNRVSSMPDFLNPKADKNKSGLSLQIPSNQSNICGLGINRL